MAEATAREPPKAVPAPAAVSGAAASAAAPLVRVAAPPAASGSAPALSAAVPAASGSAAALSAAAAPMASAVPVVGVTGAPLRIVSPGIGGPSGSGAAAPAGPEVGEPIDVNEFQGDILGRKYCVGKTPEGEYFFDYAKPPAGCDLSKIKFFRVTGDSMAEVEAELKKLLGKAPMPSATAADESPAGSPGGAPYPPGYGATVATPPPGGWGPLLTAAARRRVDSDEWGTGPRMGYPTSGSFPYTTTLLGSAAGLGPSYDDYLRGMAITRPLGAPTSASGMGGPASGEAAGDGGRPAASAAALASPAPKLLSAAEIAAARTGAKLGGNGTRKQKKSKKHASRKHSK